MSTQLDGKTLESLFIALGLSEKESKVYRLMLELGQAAVATIITKSNLKRGITYAVLYNLQKLGLVNSLAKKGKTYFQVEPPQKILELVEKKKQDINTLETSIQTIVPQLSAQYKLAVGKPTIRYYEGAEGLKEVFKDVYAPKAEPVYGAVDVEEIEKVFAGLPEDTLIPSRMKSKLAVKCIFNENERTKKFKKRDKLENRESLLIDKEKYPLPADIETYEDKVALMSFEKGNFIGMIIENKSIATTLRSVLKFIFDQQNQTPEK